MRSEYEQILIELKTIKSKISKIEIEFRRFRIEKETAEKEYLYLNEACERFRVSKRTLSRMRINGLIKDFTFQNIGQKQPRKFKYSIDELKKIFEYRV